MKRKSEGVRRLSIFIGGLAAFAWFLFVLIITHVFTDLEGSKGWLFFLGGLAVCFFIPLILIKSIYWVVIGFKKDKTESGLIDQNEESDN